MALGVDISTRNKSPPNSDCARIISASLSNVTEFAAFQAFARAQKLPIQTVSQDSLDQAQTQTQSQASLHHRGTGSVAEAAALIAAGAGATLICTRKISNDRLATCAIAITEGS